MPRFEISQVSTFATGLDHPEGLAFASDGCLWAGGEAGQIYRISPDGQSVEVVASTGGFCLGLAFDREDNLYVCDEKRATVLKVTPDRKVTTFADSAAGRPLKAPNFPVFDPEGNLYVSDSGSWYGNDGVVYRFDPGGHGEFFAGPFNFANGLAIDSAASSLYVVESCSNLVSRVQIRADGRAGDRQVFVDGVERIPDGLAFDANGTLYITCYASNRIYTADRSGGLAVLIEDPDYTPLVHPTNCAFGGEGFDELYIANLGGWHIARLSAGVKGAPLFGGPR